MTPNIIKSKQYNTVYPIGYFKIIFPIRLRFANEMLVDLGRAISSFIHRLWLQEHRVGHIL